MIRTQIQLTREQSARLRKVAREQGISLSEAIRRCVDQALSEPTHGLAERYARAARIVGALRERQGSSDVAAEHDRYLDEAFE